MITQGSIFVQLSELARGQVIRKYKIFYCNAFKALNVISKCTKQPADLVEFAFGDGEAAEGWSQELQEGAGAFLFGGFFFGW